MKIGPNLEDPLHPASKPAPSLETQHPILDRKDAPKPQVPTAGRMVLVRIGGSDAVPTLRPATIVRTWPDDIGVNLALLPDGSNDEADLVALGWVTLGKKGAYVPPVIWRGSIRLGDHVGGWRWPTRS